ncbi:hypothetical protein OAN61_00680 [bacterium]|nr:hypothetical protein [bacterium]
MVRLLPKAVMITAVHTWCVQVAGVLREYRSLLLRGLAAVRCALATVRATSCVRSKSCSRPHSWHALVCLVSVLPTRMGRCNRHIRYLLSLVRLARAAEVPPPPHPLHLASKRNC